MSGPPLIFDRLAIARARARAERGGGDAFLVREAAEGIAARLDPINRNFGRAADVDGLAVGKHVLNRFARSWTSLSSSESETLEFGAEPFDLVTSVLALHSTNDLPGALVQIRRALVLDGVFAAALFGGATLYELRQSLAAAEAATHGGTSPRISPFADVRVLGQLLQRAGFALPVADVERTTVLYSRLEQLVHDLRVHGQTNSLHERSRRPISRATLSAAEAHYRLHHADEAGRLRASFDIVYLIGWAPSESQPQPLKPGTARLRLADVLGVTEKGAPSPSPTTRRDDQT
jgi:SAM-dependent methyltransferase